MNKALLSFLFFIAAFTASSQRIYFIYLQTESQQPFFVKIGEKLNSSTASGYLILSRLKDSTYNFTIGFPGNRAGDQKFSCAINKKDHGYLVKNFGDKGWGLVDLQTQSIQMAVNDGKKDVSATNVPVNAFTDLLAKAADDSTLRQKIVLPEEKKPEVVAVASEKKEEVKENAVSKPDVPKTGVASAPLVETTLKKEEPKKEIKQNTDTLAKKNLVKEDPKPVKPAPDTIAKREENKPGDKVVKESLTSGQQSFVRTKIIRKSESSTTEGFGLIFIDVQQDGKQDTVRITIPNESKTPVTNEPAIKDTIVKKEKIATTDNNTILTAPTDKTVLKNNCKQTASDDDFYKLRKKMAAGKNDGDMMNEANKIFKIKCFTTSQIKNLGTLFLGDGGKYNFFDAAYLHVSDTDNFSSLQSELKDEYFINRFKAMLR
ncbi:MAG: DUF4476 domain-containing protein [Bacteroidota bacterium]